MSETTTDLIRRIRTLIDAPTAGDEAPSAASIERTLTDGYAYALALEAESWRLERRMTELTSRLSEDAGDAIGELTMLGRRLSHANGELSGLRSVLAVLRERVYRAEAA